VVIVLITNKYQKQQIILCGFMGSGKSLVGEKLAVRLGRTFVDTDRVIETGTGLTISELFARQGEARFRQLEEEAVRSLFVYNPGSLVVATGGGVLINPENRKHLKKMGILILLTATPLALLRRIRKQKGRPLLNNAGSPAARISELMAERAVFYSCCDLVFDTTGKTAERVAFEIAKKLS
jgi:shikimate kinase